MTFDEHNVWWFWAACTFLGALLGFIAVSIGRIL